LSSPLNLKPAKSRDVILTSPPIYKISTLRIMTCIFGISTKVGTQTLRIMRDVFLASPPKYSNTENYERCIFDISTNIQNIYPENYDMHFWHLHQSTLTLRIVRDVFLTSPPIYLYSEYLLRDVILAFLSLSLSLSLSPSLSKQTKRKLVKFKTYFISYLELTYFVHKIADSESKLGT
jgi:hypothetical protein